MTLKPPSPKKRHKAHNPTPPWWQAPPPRTTKAPGWDLVDHRPKCIMPAATQDPFTMSWWCGVALLKRRSINIVFVKMPHSRQTIFFLQRPTEFLNLWDALELWKKNCSWRKLISKDQFKLAFLAFKKNGINEILCVMWCFHKDHALWCH